MSEPHTYAATAKHKRDEAIRWLRDTTQALVMTDKERKTHMARRWGKAISDEVWLMRTRKLI